MEGHKLVDRARGLLKGLLRALLVGVLFVATCATSTVGIYKVHEIRSVESVTFPPPPAFPVIVVTDNGGAPHATALYHSEMDAFRRSNPDHSFLIPPGTDARLNDELLAASRVSFSGAARYEDPDIQWDAGFEVLEREGEEQYIRAYRTHDDDRDNTGWYRATAEGYYPRRYRRLFGPSGALLAGMLAILLTSALFFGIGTLRARDARRRR